MNFYIWAVRVILCGYGMRRGKRDPPTKAEVAVEYLFTTISGLGIVVVAIFILSALFFGVSGLAPNYCNFNIGLNCADLLVTSNATTTMFAMLGSNPQQYAFTNLSLSVVQEGSATSAQCTPQKINPGQSFLCIIKLNIYKPLGSYSSGDITAHVAYCTLGDCTNTLPMSYVGKYKTTTAGFKVPSLNVTLSSPPPSPSVPASINVNLNVFQHNFTLSTVTVSPSQQPVIVVNTTSTYLVQTPVKNNTVYCGGPAVNVSVTGLNANKRVGVWSQLTNVSSVKISGYGNNESFALVSKGKVSISGNSNIGCILVKTPANIDVDLSGGNNTARLYNGNMTVSVSGNNNKAYLTNAQASKATVSGNNNNVCLRNTTVAQKSISGTNNFISAC